MRAAKDDGLDDQDGQRTDQQRPMSWDVGPRKRAPMLASQIAFRRQYSHDPSKEIPAESPTKHDPCLQWTRNFSLFLGPKGENEEEFKRLAQKAIERHCRARKEYFVTDKEMITSEIKNDKAFVKSIKVMEDELEKMSRRLEQSVPSFSPRYQGHMLWDTAMPANLGYIQALLYNQNNVAIEASPVTTDMEVEVCSDLCEMIFGTCGKEDNINCKPWAQLTTGGSIANKESIWVSRNVKFVPLALKKIVMDEPQFSCAKDFKVFLPKFNDTVRLIDQSDWDLLNLDIDDIVKLPDEVVNTLENDHLKHEMLNHLQSYSVGELGMHDIMETFGLKKSPVVIAPATSHYSWKKAVNIMGLGARNMKRIEVDEKARMEVKDLENELEKCLKEEIPVISVVVVIGSTEESAVDPLNGVLKLRDQMREKGLNFAINADAAWGGYFMTMLEKTDIVTINKNMEEYVPYCDISGHTYDQLKCLHKADTVTVDPHKSGFIPYSAGALCLRNGKLRNFIKMEATVVAHEGEVDLDIGICSIQGSRPGAAAAAVLMAHRTIGLNAEGYGRILGQCMFGAKMFYYRWLTLAKDNDPFILVLMKDIPVDIDLEVAKAVLTAFLFSSETRNSEIFPMSDLRKMFRRLGPDMLINAFSVNIKGNKDVDLCNKLNKLIYRMLSHSSTQKNVIRVPLILTQSEVDPTISRRVAENMKKRLGLEPGTTDSLHFLINTVMNPFIGRPKLITTLGDIFRQTVLTAIGTLTDQKTLFRFICVDQISTIKSGCFFVELLPSFSSKSHQYQAVVQLQFADTGSTEGDIEFISDSTGELFVDTLEGHESTLGELLERTESFDVSITSSTNKEITLRRNVFIKDVPLFQRFDLSIESAFPNATTHFLYGSQDNIHMTHLSHDPSYLQVCNLKKKPEHVSDHMLHQGIEVTFLNSSQESEGKRKYISFIGENGIKRKSKITVTTEKKFPCLGGCKSS